MENETERRVYYRESDGTKASVAGIVDADSDSQFILIERRDEIVQIPRKRLDYISRPKPRPGGHPS